MRRIFQRRDRVVMGWAAKKVLRVQRDGQIVLVNPGEPVPEAAHWKNRGAYERQGYIMFVQSEPPKEYKPLFSTGPRSEGDKPTGAKRGRPKKMVEPVAVTVENPVADEPELPA